MIRKSPDKPVAESIPDSGTLPEGDGSRKEGCGFALQKGLSGGSAECPEEAERQERSG